jgi:phospholipid transport system substrate-binding protein
MSCRPCAESADEEKKMKKTLLFPTLLCLAVMLFPLFSAAAPGPLEEVQTTVDSIIALLKRDDLSREERQEKVGALVRERFDFRTMSQGVLATNWKKATDAEKKQFMDLFSELLETTYRERIDAYNNEEVKYLSEKIRGKKAVVETVVVTTDVEIPVTYKLLNKGESWRAYDVVVEGVSLVRNYRDSYKEIVKKEGLTGLLAKMEKKIEELRTNPAEGSEQ